MHLCIVFSVKRATVNGGISCLEILCSDFIMWHVVCCITYMADWPAATKSESLYKTDIYQDFLIKDYLSR